MSPSQARAQARSRVESACEWSLAASWDHLPAGETVFASPAWLTATAKALPFELKVLEGRKEGKLACYLPLQIVRRGGLSKAFTPILTYYGGPYFPLAPGLRFHERAKLRYDLTAEALRWLDGRFHYLLLTPDDAEVRAGIDQGWDCRPRVTVLNRLRAEDGRDPGGDTLRNVRKAEKAGLTLGPGRDDEAFGRAFARTFARKGLAMRWKAEWAVALRRELTAAGLLENRSVISPEGREIAFASVALDRPRNRAVLWYSCSLEEADRTGAMHFLIQGLLDRYRADFEVFDLCGADHRGLSEFKEKFGHELFTRHALEKYRGPVSRALLGAFARARRLAG
ncbi:MAG TPA: hypothetical protein VJ385_03280 [Fibrobacteria bacterium]|nr:hypothetical protein [Fibrobacteria bacterium]